jgi:hypothetical protein
VCVRVCVRRERKGNMQGTGGLGRLREGRELVRVTRRVRVTRLRLRSQRLEHGKAERERISQHMPPGPQGEHTYQHRMTRVSQEHQDQASLRVNRGRQRFSVHKALWRWQRNSAGFHRGTVRLLDWRVGRPRPKGEVTGRLRTTVPVVQIRSKSANRRASCLHCLLLCMTLRIHRQDGATRDCTLSPLADSQHKHSSDVGYQR